MDIQERERDFQIKVNRLINFSYELRKEFIAYWTELNKSGTKMRFELEKTWDLNRRVLRWANQSKIGINSASKNGLLKQPEIVSTIPEVNELDKLLEVYKLHPTTVEFEVFGRYYEFMKLNKLLKPLTQQTINDLQEAYHNNKFKCRCACVS